jgi:ribosome-associated protein
MTQESENEQKEIENVLDDNKAQDIESINVQHLTTITDYMIICTATSRQHAQSLANKLLRYCKDNQLKNIEIEGYNSAEWVLVNTSNTIIHIFQQDAREKYDLEKLWAISESTINKIRAQE